MTRSAWALRPDAPITSYEWEYRRINEVGTVVVDDSGTTLSTGTFFPAPDSDIHREQFLGWSRHPLGPSNGGDWTFEVRVAAVNENGQGDWSEWGVWTGDGYAPHVYVETSTSSSPSTCSGSTSGGTCAVFFGIVKGLGVSQTYDFVLLSRESTFPFTEIVPGVTTVQPSLPCLGSVSTDLNGDGSFAVECETLTNPTYIRLVTDEGYMSVSQNLFQSDVFFWHLVGS